MGQTSNVPPLWPDSDDPAPLSLGLIYSRSTSGEAWQAAVMKLMRAVKKACEDLPETPAAALEVNVVFQVAGLDTPLDFEGVRTGTFRRSKNMLVVQAAISSTTIDDPALDPDATVRALFYAAIDEAERDGLSGRRWQTISTIFGKSRSAPSRTDV